VDGLHYRVISREFIHGYLHTSVIMATLLAQSIVKKCFVDTRSEWLNLLCLIAGVSLWLSSHICNYGTIIGPVDHKDVLRGRTLWMV